MKTLSGQLAKTTGVLGLTVAALTTVSASPATAGTTSAAGCTKYYANANIQVQVDNCSDGWVWVYAASGGTYFKATVYVTNTFNGQEPQVLTADEGKSNAHQYINVYSFRFGCGSSEVKVPIRL
ncbi:hypothetical protein ACIREE_42075 [Streptomyces sp. NPDC102467]|uniref:hypothetical protein n=1 Tax=Streptomyces sp. NPDC102467 TaxID=3366179 RepID=UPI00380023E1